MSEMTTASLESPSDPAITKNTFKRHYSDLSKAIGPFPEVLLSVSNGFYKHSFIDLQSKVDVNSQSSGLTGASMLLDHVMMKIEQSDHYLPLVMDVLREEVALTDVVEKMKESVTADCNQGSCSSDTPTTAHSPDDQTPLPDSTVADTISAAKRLKDKFESLCSLVMMIINHTVIDLAQLKLKICLRLQDTRDNTSSAVQEHLRELEGYNKAESIFMFLIIRNFLGYLNFDLLEVLKSALSSDEFNEKLEEYQSAHNHFIRHNFQNIVEAFNQNPRLRPASIIGLPEIKVELATPWKSKSLYYWKELVNDIVDWGPYIVITRVEFNCVSITYQVLPFIIPRVVKDLTNETVVKRFTALGATFTVSDELVQDGIADNQWIMDAVHEQRLRLWNTTRKNEEGDDPNESIETTNQPNIQKYAGSQCLSLVTKATECIQVNPKEAQKYLAIIKETLPLVLQQLEKHQTEFAAKRNEHELNDWSLRQKIEDKEYKKNAKSREIHERKAENEALLQATKIAECNKRDAQNRKLDGRIAGIVAGGVGAAVLAGIVLPPSLLFVTLPAVAIGTFSIIEAGRGKEVENYKNRVTEIQRNIESEKQQMRNIDAEISGMEREIASLNAEQQFLRTKLSSVREALTFTQKAVKIFSEIYEAVHAGDQKTNLLHKVVEEANKEEKYRILSSDGEAIVVNSFANAWERVEDKPQSEGENRYLGVMLLDQQGN